MAIQMRVPGRAGSVWMSPDRDIAHAFKDYVASAVGYLDKTLPPDAENRAEVEAFCKRVMAFAFDGGNVDCHKMSTADMLKKHGLLPANEAEANAEKLFAKALLRVVLGAYWRGAVEAYNGES